MKKFSVLLGIVLLLIWGGVRVVSYIQFDRNCEGYLKRAADANNITLARGELAKALKYMESHELTNGYTSILYTTPDEDVEFWYINIKSAYEQLLKLDPEAVSDLEESNILMKLRETLCDNGKDGSSITVPSGISIYPYNVLWCVMAFGGLLFMLLGIGWKEFFDIIL